MSNRSLTLLSVIFLTSVKLLADDADFVGKWKINIAKSNLTGIPAIMEDLGENKYLYREGNFEETLFVDGKEHATESGDMRTITQVGPRHWKSVYKRDGKVTATDEWSISDDEKTLTYNVKGSRLDGSTFDQTYKNKRTAGTSGMAGTWENEEAKIDTFPGIAIEPFGGEGISLLVPAYKERCDLKFDGKDYAVEGPRAAPGLTTAGKRVDKRKLELTDRLRGKIVSVRLLELSTEGETLTSTIADPATDKKEVRVYERE